MFIERGESFCRYLFQLIVCHVDAIGEWHFQQLISEFDRFKYDMYSEFTGVVGQFFKGQKLQLDGERGISHFESPGDFPVWTKWLAPNDLKFVQRVITREDFKR